MQAPGNEEQYETPPKSAKKTVGAAEESTVPAGRKMSAEAEQEKLQEEHTAMWVAWDTMQHEYWDEWEKWENKDGSGDVKLEQDFEDCKTSKLPKQVQTTLFALGSFPVRKPEHLHTVAMGTGSERPASQSKVSNVES